MGVATAALLLVAVTAPGSAATRRTSRSTRPVIPPVIVPASASAWDMAVSDAARRGLGKTAGAVVAMDPFSGRIITIVNPTYGLFNAYQPCSVFKVVVAIAGLTEGVITPDTIYRCHKGCWSWPGHGPIDLRRALGVSCNPYFEWIGEQIGYEKVERYSRLLGLGETTGINLTGETRGRLPAKVSPAAVGHLSSHAEGITTSAVQLAVLLSATINGGVVWQPQVGPALDFAPKERWRLPPETRLEGLVDGFLAAVNEGSALPAFDPDVIVAGKTGSCSRLGWFASYGPADKPQLVLVVFVRRGNGHTASAIAGRIYQELYKPQPSVPLTAAGG
jgi:cell division protein FtsI/penicillin-binding protein 2